MVIEAERLAGARVLRAIGPGERCRVLLAHVPQEGAAGRLIVLKELTGDDAAHRAARELAALERAAGPHVVAALDLASAGNGYVIELEHLGGASLSELLIRRSVWAAGEIVTLVAPVADALRRMHGAGVAHGAVTAAHIVLTASGSPTLVGFGAAELFAPGSPEEARAELQAVAGDREGMRVLVRMLLGRVAGSERQAAAALADELVRLDPESVLDFCAERLFGLAAAAPVGKGDPLGSAEPVQSSRRSPVEPGRTALDPGEADERTVEASSTASGVAGLLAGVLPDTWLAALRERIPDRVTDAVLGHLARLGDRVRGLLAGRGRLLLAGGAAGMLVLAVLILLPTLPAKESETAGPAASTPPAPHAGTAVTGDDPVAAAAELVAGRERCFRELSALCLETVDEQGSVALARDRRAIQEAQAAGVLDAEALAVGENAMLELAESLGGYALVRTGDSAAPALLLVRGEQGWRIRDIIASAGPVWTGPAV